MNLERTYYFAADYQPKVFPMDLCETILAGKHEECPTFLKYDREEMEALEGEIATEYDLVFCICPCHLRLQA
jgi:hypothetical protein